MELDIKEIAKNCTKEEFLKNIVCNKDGDIVEFFGRNDVCYCPADYGLEERCNFRSHCIKDCWIKAIENLEFIKQEGLEINLDGARKAFKIANNAIYFSDSADYASALWEICKTLSPKMSIEEIGSKYYGEDDK